MQPHCGGRSEPGRGADRLLSPSQEVVDIEDSLEPDDTCCDAYPGGGSRSGRINTPAGWVDIRTRRKICCEARCRCQSDDAVTTNVITSATKRYQVP